MGASKIFHNFSWTLINSYKKANGFVYTKNTVAFVNMKTLSPIVSAFVG